MGKGQVDEFAWILIGALAFILFISLLWGPSLKEPVPVVSPKSIDLIIARGSSASFFLSVNGSSAGKMTNVTLALVGDVKSWLSFDKNNFDIDGFTNVKVIVAAPGDTAVRIYTGSIKVSSKGGEVSVPLTINVVSGPAEVKLKSRPIELGDINIRYLVGPEDIASREDFEVSKSYFGESKEETVSILIPSEKLPLMKSGYISLSVESSNKDGNLVVIFNGKEVLNSQVTGTITVPIEKSLINDTNVIVVRATLPPLYKFWSKTVYSIKKLSFGGNYEDVLERERIFDLKDEEISSFKYFRLTGRVGSYSKVSELSIEINGQLVYSKIPPLALFNETLEKTMLGDTIYLRSKNNTVSFSFKKESSYKLDSAFLIVYY